MKTYNKEKLVTWLEEEIKNCENELKYAFDYCNISYFKGTRNVLLIIQKKLERGDFKNENV